MNVCFLCVLSEVSASGRSLVQRSPTECGVSKCDREDSIMRPRPSRGCWNTKKKYIDRRDYYCNHCYLHLFVTILFFSHLVYSYDTVLNNLKLHRRHLPRMDKVMETGVKDTHFFIKTELGLHLPVIQLF